MITVLELHALKRIARYAGLIYVVFAAAFIYGAVFVPTHLGISSLNIEQSAATIREHEFFYRTGLLSQLISQLLFLFLVHVLSWLFDSVSSRASTLMRSLVHVAVTCSLVLLIIQLTAGLVLLGKLSLPSLTPDGAMDIGRVLLRINAVGTRLVELLWGLWLFPFGVLVIRSRFIPKVLGYLLYVAGVAYVMGSLLFVLVPDTLPSVSFILMPLYSAEVPIIFWLLIWGVRAPKRD